MKKLSMLVGSPTELKGYLDDEFGKINGSLNWRVRGKKNYVSIDNENLKQSFIKLEQESDSRMGELRFYVDAENNNPQGFIVQYVKIQSPTLTDMRRKYYKKV